MELIAVVAVILILVAIVVPRIGDLRGDAKNARDGANKNIVQGAFERAKVQGMYAPDTAVALPTSAAEMATSVYDLGLISKQITTTGWTTVGGGTSLTIQ